MAKKVKKAPKKSAKNPKKIVPQTNSKKGSKVMPPKKDEVIIVKVKPTKTDIKKKAMIAALTKTLGVVTTAVNIVKMDRSMHYDWMALDPEYRKAVLSIEDVALDFAESKLHTRIGSGDTTATIFFLKTKGKKRGYIERSEVQHDIPPAVVGLEHLSFEQLMKLKEKNGNKKS